MKFENTEVYGFEAAFRGMRNPIESWARSDSNFAGEVEIGEKDLGLAVRLIKSGTEHRKFLRQIQVWVDITAPIYWWKEFDTYKVGTVANSTSTMHKLMSKPITRECFDFDGIYKEAEDEIIEALEYIRKAYLEYKEEDPEIAKNIWRHLVQMLPCSWLQTRTVSMNYENLRTIVHQRKGHKLKEWSEDFMDWAMSLPYAQQLIFD